MKKIYCFFFAILVTKIGLCQEWIYLGTTNQLDKYYIKSAYISKVNYGNRENVVRIWGKTILGSWTYKKRVYKNVLTKALWEVDCKNKQNRVSIVIYYSATGSIIKESPGSEFDPFDDPPPDSMGEKLINTVCNLFN